MTGDEYAAFIERTRAARVAAGLPPTIVDPEVHEVLAGLLTASRSKKKKKKRAA